MSQVNAMDFLGKTFRYRPRYDAQISEYFPKFNQGKVVSVVANLPELGRPVELCFSDDDTAFYSLDALEFLELVPDDTVPVYGRILAIISMVTTIPVVQPLPSEIYILRH